MLRDGVSLSINKMITYLSSYQLVCLSVCLSVCHTRVLCRVQVRRGGGGELAPPNSANVRLLTRSSHCDTLFSCALEIFLLTYLLTYGRLDWNTSARHSVTLGAPPHIPLRELTTLPKPSIWRRAGTHSLSYPHVLLPRCIFLIIILKYPLLATCIASLPSWLSATRVSPQS